MIFRVKLNVGVNYLVFSRGMAARFGCLALIPEGNR